MSIAYQAAPMPSEYEIVEQFRGAMAEQGIVVADTIIADGKIHRYHSEGDRRGSKNAWAVLHIDEKPAGMFGCNKRHGDHKFSWSAKRSSQPLTHEERQALREKNDRQRADKAAAEAARQAVAAERAQAIWEAATPLVGGSDHPYLKRKGVKPYGLRVGAWKVTNPETGEIRTISDNAILVPIRQRAGNQLRNLQAIFPSKLMSGGTRDKDYLKHGEKTGLFHGIGKPLERDGKKVFIIVEGYATGASVHEATGHCVLVAFDTSNLLPVAKQLRERLAEALIVFAADNDQFTHQPVPNPGVTYAKVAAQEVGGLVAIPKFSDLTGEPTDFNDLAARQGGAAVAEAIEAAIRGEHVAPVAVAAPVEAAGMVLADVFEPVPESEGVRWPGANLRVHVDQLPAVDGDELIYDDKDPMPIARDMVRRIWSYDGSRTVQHRCGEFVKWDGGAYAECSDHDVRAVTWLHLENAQRWVRAAGKESGELVLGQFKPNRQKVADVVDAVRAVANVPGSISAPSWLAEGEARPAADQILPCANGLFHLPSGDLLQHTPEFFSFNCLPFDFDPAAPEPVEWLTFLKTIWADDQESVDTLQKMLGYLLTADTSLQKIFLLVGPPRCGKGTILRVIEGLLGKANICAPDLNSIHERFALEGFIGKQAALIGDARISPKADQAAIAARLLSISGEDAMGIDRKNRPYWFGKLNTRFVVCSNMVPTLSDASGALASRFVILTMKHSFLGKEDHDLGDRLNAEMPGILKWAIEGWHKLQSAGRIETPKAAAEYAEELDDLASPIRKFLREVCVVGDGRWVACKELYAAWRDWCADNGREHPGTETAFGRDLRGARHSISRKQRRVKTDRVWVYEGLAISDAIPPI